MVVDRGIPRCAPRPSWTFFFLLLSSQVGMVVVTCIGDVLILNISAGGYIFLFPCYMKTTTKRGKLVLYFTNFFFFSFSACVPLYFPRLVIDWWIQFTHTHIQREILQEKRIGWNQSIHVGEQVSEEIDDPVVKKGNGASEETLEWRNTSKGRREIAIETTVSNCFLWWSPQRDMAMLRTQQNAFPFFSFFFFFFFYGSNLSISSDLWACVVSATLRWQTS